MRRSPTRAAGRLIAGLAAVLLGVAVPAVGIGPTASAGATTTSTTAATPVAPSTTAAPGAALAWLTTEARPANGRLNRDQVTIVSITRTGGEATAGVFFSELHTACRSMLVDARRAARLPKAPTAALQKDWQAMARATATYASDCLTLTRTRTSASFTRWNASLHPMNLASATLNTLVQQIRGQQ